MILIFKTQHEALFTRQRNFNKTFARSFSFQLENSGAPGISTEQKMSNVHFTL